MTITAASLSAQLTSVVEAASPSVVRVEGGRRPVTGVAWDATHVVTTAQGVAREDVVVFDGVERSGRVVGRDETTDLALIEVAGAALTPARFVDDEGLKVGQLVLRLGRPGDTVRATSGIISTLGTKPFRGAGGGELSRYLESDADHQPGFSGGPLLTLEGGVVGLTSTAVVPRTSLTVPTATVRRVVTALVSHGKVRHSYLGLKLQPVQLPDEVRSSTGEELGLLVLGVEQGSPAHSAGLTYGDTVLHLGDDTVRTLQDFYGYLRQDRAGQQVPVKVFRQGQVSTVQLTLGAR